MGYFEEIEEGTFSQVLAIRQKRAKGKKLEQWERELLNDNQALVNLKKKMSDEEQDLWQQEQDAVDKLFEK